MNALIKIGNVKFPPAGNLVVNMMPIVFGDRRSIPGNLQGYIPMIEKAGFVPGRLAYLTVHESWVSYGQTQRRPGIHTDGTMHVDWGGLPWGGGVQVPPKPAPPPKPKNGIYMASSDGACRAWDEMRYDADAHGALKSPPKGREIQLIANTLYWMTDRTPHESLPTNYPHYRQFFRLVGDEVGVWYAKHNTPNPLGVMPGCPIDHGDKFESLYMGRFVSGEDL